MSLLATTRLVPGLAVYYQGKRYHIEDLINISTVLIRDENGRRETAPASDLIIREEHSAATRMELASIPDKKWRRAQERLRIISPLLEMSDKERTREVVKAVAENNSYDTATIYRWIRAYKASGLVTSLIRKPRVDKGGNRLSQEVDAIISDMIDRFYLTEQRSSIKRVIRLIGSACASQDIRPPAEVTVYRRIAALSDELKTSRRYGSKIAQERFQQIRGKFPDANFPLAVVQIDHTKVDVIVVDEKHRLPIGRPYLTIATDVYSKMCVGYYLSFDPVGALAAGQCIANAILPKDDYLASLGIDPKEYQWPCWGVMRRIHTDNAKEFHGEVLGRAAEQYGIIVEHRPKRATRFGGNVERAFRTYMKNIHDELPGTTFSNVRSKYDYDSEGNAVMTFDALEMWFAQYLVGDYHQAPHRGNNGVPPIAKWEQGIFGTDTDIGTGLPVVETDEKQLRLSFMPSNRRTVQRSGVEFEGLTYSNPAIRKFVKTRSSATSKLARQFLIRYDPRDMSTIWLYDPDSNEHIPLSSTSKKDTHVSLWELRSIKRELAGKGYTVNQRLIHQSIEDRKRIVESEANLTKSARKERQKAKQQKKSSLKASIRPVQSDTANGSSAPTQTWDDDDLQPFKISGEY